MVGLCVCVCVYLSAKNPLHHGVVLDSGRPYVDAIKLKNKTLTVYFAFIKALRPVSRSNWISYCFFCFGQQPCLLWLSLQPCPCNTATCKCCREESCTFPLKIEHILKRIFKSLHWSLHLLFLFAFVLHGKQQLLDSGFYVRNMAFVLESFLLSRLQIFYSKITINSIT